MADVRVLALHRDERGAVLELLKARLLSPQKTDDPEMLQAIAEQFLRPLTFHELGALNDR